MQKVNTTMLKVTFASTLMAKRVPSKPTQDILALFYSCEHKSHRQLEPGTCGVLLGQCLSSLRHSLNQVEVGHFRINVYVFTYLVASKLCIKYVDSPGIKKRIDLCELIGYFIKLIIYE